MPTSVGEWIAFALLWSGIGVMGWWFIGFPLWFMSVEEPRERRAREAKRDLESQWDYLTDDDIAWFAEQGIEDPRPKSREMLNTRWL